MTRRLWLAKLGWFMRKIKGTCRHNILHRVVKSKTLATLGGGAFKSQRQNGSSLGSHWLSAIVYQPKPTPVYPNYFWPHNILHEIWLKLQLSCSLKRSLWELAVWWTHFLTRAQTLFLSRLTSFEWLSLLLLSDGLPLDFLPQQYKSN